ncbi:MAG: hypothetical protein WC455_11175 [Dehalococcoidia bacterium]|jgi:hypothetical protein
MQYRIPDSIEKKLDVYRRNMKLEAGKMMTRGGAINRILSESLDGVEDVKLPSFANLALRVRNLEEWAAEQ